MKIIRYPEKTTWPDILRRPNDDHDDVEEKVRVILDAVRNGGDEVLRAYTKTFDGVDTDCLAVTDEELAAAVETVPEELKSAMRTAMSNIEKFHAAQRQGIVEIETMPGVTCWQRSVPIEKVGLYIPAGTAPLFSTLLMLGIPARLAGCREVVLCSPPAANRRIVDAVLFASQLVGIKKVFKAGGAQAIGALAYGTQSIPAVHKIFGPGNQFVTVAKQLVSKDVAVDMPAGPSELAILADNSSVPRFLAADLISQAEHGSDSQVLLVTTSDHILIDTIEELERQLVDLPRQKFARSALQHSKVILVGSLEEGIALINEYAPEHLILAVDKPSVAALAIKNAGSVFLGNYSCESAGDYAAGTNHTLPTAGFARAFSGVSLESFTKKITFQCVTQKGLLALGPTIECMANAEGLEGHRRAVAVRTGGR